MKRFLLNAGAGAVLLAGAAVAAPAWAGVAAADVSCTKDSQCTLVMTSCNSCCPLQTSSDLTPVSTAQAFKYGGANLCTPAHIQACGVPECGLRPEPMPAAVCQQGKCAIVIRAVSLPRAGQP